MTGTTHLVIGTGVTLSVIALMNQEITAPAVAIAVISSLLPDIDEPKSLLVSRSLPKAYIKWLRLTTLLIAVLTLIVPSTWQPWNWLVGGLALIIACAAEGKLRRLTLVVTGASVALLLTTYSPWNYMGGAMLAVCAILPHRGLTHSFYALGCWMLLLYGIGIESGYALWLAGGMAYALHLLADAVTARGIRPLPPMKWKLRLPLMRTGHWSGTMLETLCVGLTFVLAWYVFIQR